MMHYSFLQLIKMMMVMLMMVMVMMVLHLCEGGKYNPRVGEIHPTLLQSYLIKKLRKNMSRTDVASWCFKWTGLVGLDGWPLSL